MLPDTQAYLGIHRIHIQEDFGILRKPWEYLGRPRIINISFRSTYECRGMFRSAWDQLGIIRNAQECSGMFRDYCRQMFERMRGAI